MESVRMKIVTDEIYLIRTFLVTINQEKDLIYRAQGGIISS